MNNLNVNSAALLRSLVVYAVCVLLSIVVGYMLTNITDYGDRPSMLFICVLASLLIFPLLMKWHYPLLLFSWSCPLTLFFLPGHPNLFLPLVAASLSISVVERIMNKEQQFLPAAPVRWPLLALLAVVLVTAKLTGGFGLRSMGSEVYGGRKYVILVIGILSFFALTARAIPRKYANFYITLYFAGSFFNFISDYFPYVPGPLHFIYWLFPMSDTDIDPMGNIGLQFGVTRMLGTSVTAGALFYWMLARHGFRDIFLTNKLWRPLVLGLAFTLMFLGGFRSAIGGALLVFGLIFYLEGMHRTGVMLAVVLAGVLAGALLVPLTQYLPYTFQRALAFLPLKVNADVRMDTDGSTQWRLDMWEALLPEVPKYFWKGKGYAFSAELFNDMGRNTAFREVIDASQNPLALANDFHSGPLSVIIPFGIWGVVVWLWFWAAGFWVVWRNYHYGDPAIRHINLFLFASFVAKCISFIFIFGDLVADMSGFAGIIGLSIAMNHGIMRPRPRLQPAASPAAAPPPLALPAQPAFQR